MQIEALRDLEVVVALENLGRLGRDAHLLRLLWLLTDLPAEGAEIGDAVVIGLDLGRDGGRLLRAVFRQGGLLSGGAAQPEHQQNHGDENEQRNCDQLAFGNFGSHDDHRDPSYACLID